MAAEDEIDALYDGDPDDFVAARQALVKRLRAEGDKQAAAEVGALRRPTAAAWAVNQLARRHPERLARLAERGDDLRRAHQRLMSGGRDDDTAAAGRRRREAVADLVEVAAGILTESGRSGDAHRDAIAATLDAASLDPDVGAEVAAGRLAKELDPPAGFGEWDWAAAAAAPPPRPPPRTAPSDDDHDDAAAEQARRRAERRDRAATARAAAVRARDLADQARAAADHADRERERLEEEVVRARKTANDARRAARELRDAAHEAERQADALEDAARA